MSDDTAEKPSPPPEGGRKRFEYFVDGNRYEVETSSITGAQIKAKIPNYNPSFQLFLEGKGTDPDRVIGDADSVSLERGAAHLYTAPPATFGTATAPAARGAVTPPER